MYRVGTPLTKTVLQFCRKRLPEEIPGITYPPSITILPTPSILRHVAIHLESRFDEEVAEGVDLTDMHDLFGDASGIATFCLENGIPSYDLPLFSFRGLKSIQIEEPERPGYSTPMSKIMAILAASPDLHVFILAGNKSSEDGKVDEIHGSPARIISLPALRILSLQSIDIPHLLDHIRTPSLEKLKLGNELQSGWNRSVASSLRNLIYRSGHPHITRLRINDLSTPQALSLQDWACFDALPHLVSFRIHHTHFPDTLLQALTIDPVAVIQEQPRNPTQPHHKLLCPKLSKLVFENCDFSGAALIKFVKSRQVIQSRLYEEAVAQGNENDRGIRKMIEQCHDISELWVGTCPMVGDEDVAELKMLLGGKFQSSLSPGASDSQ
ncbi:hypothetical protein FRC03_000094 [Tulasnella sp. 419]|nr:hypothetical protein FRC03_000094 [Tulasnella sp. 419]